MPPPDGPKIICQIPSAIHPGTWLVTFDAMCDSPLARPLGEVLPRRPRPVATAQTRWAPRHHRLTPANLNLRRRSPIRDRLPSSTSTRRTRFPTTPSPTLWSRRNGDRGD